MSLGDRIGDIIAWAPDWLFMATMYVSMIFAVLLARELFPGFLPWLGDWLGDPCPGPWGCGP